MRPEHRTGPGERPPETQDRRARRASGKEGSTPAQRRGSVAGAMAPTEAPLDSSSGGRPPAGPRAEDHALLRRLESEVALEVALAGSGIGPLPARASGLVELVRAAGGEAAVLDALARHGAPLRVWLFEHAPRGLPPALVHHLAVLADHALGATLRAAAPHSLPLAEALDRVVVTWLELGRVPSYLQGEAARAAGGGLPASATTALLQRLPLRGLERCRALATEGLRDRDRAGAEAVRALRRCLRALPELALPAPLEERASALARASLADLAMRWLVRFEDALHELLARRWTCDDADALLADAAAAWTWLDEDPELERHVLTALPDLAWPLYRERKMDELGRLVAKVLPLATALEARVLQDRAEGRLETDLAYVAPCAQALVFWAEIPREIELALPRIERAYALCPTLRNARVVLAHRLCDRAERTLARRELFPAHPPRQDVERAARVFPELWRLDALKARVGIAP